MNKCFICGYYSKFLPFGKPNVTSYNIIGGGYRDHCLCPSCGSLDRDRLIALYLINRSNILDERKKNILHVAPEYPIKRLIRIIKPDINQAKCSYITADLNYEDVDVRLDITNIPFEGSSFDIILCNHVLEHVIEDRRAISELYRVMKKDGWGILQVPIAMGLCETYEDYSIVNPKEREMEFGQLDHVRLYGEDYINRVGECGFEVETFRWVDYLDEFGGVGNLYGLNPYEKIYITTK